MGKYDFEDTSSGLLAEPSAMAYGSASYFTEGTSALAIKVPTKDLTLAKEMISRMGWNLFVDCISDRKMRRNKNVKSALARLKGCVSVSEDYDYKEELALALEEKYQRP